MSVRYVIYKLGMIMLNLNAMAQNRAESYPRNMIIDHTGEAVLWVKRNTRTSYMLPSIHRAPKYRFHPKASGQAAITCTLYFVIWSTIRIQWTCDIFSLKNYEKDARSHGMYLWIHSLNNIIAFSLNIMLNIML